MYNKLYKTRLTIEQLRFCIDYSIAFNTDYDELEINEGEDIIDALEMILKNQFFGFDKYFKMPNVDYTMHVYAPREILLKEEMLPYKISKWIDSHLTIIELTSQLKNSRWPHIAIRVPILEDNFVGDYMTAANDPNIDNTIKWAIDKNLTYTYDSERYKNMMGIIENLPSKYSNMPFLRYTGDVVIENDIPKPTFKLERCQEECSFLSTFAWGTQFEKRLSKSQKLVKFIKDNVVYVYGESELLYKQDRREKPRWAIQTAVDVDKYPEYRDPIYDSWKDMPESKGMAIYISNKPIAMNFCILSSNESIFSDMMHDNDFGFIPGKSVVIQNTGEEEMSKAKMIKTIAKHISDIEFFKEPFIALQTLYIEQSDANEGTDEKGKSTLTLSNSALTEEQAQAALNKISTETAKNLEKVNSITQQIDEEGLAKLNESANAIMTLLEELGKDELDYLANNKDRIMQAMEDLSEAEEEEKESKVRQTIGFIGELIYGQYLESKHKEYVHAALEGVGEYDFEIKSDNMFVDVKTTLYSLKDGTAPFYLHRSQNSYMQTHPNSKYHIVRISLFDLNLKNSYEELRNVYGKDANPLENERLRKECEKMAKKYWRGAKIEEFDALSPEYAIHIEKK